MIFDFGCPQCCFAYWGQQLFLRAVFFFCCHSAADMPFLLVLIQDFANLDIQTLIELWQALGKIFMYRGFGNTELLCRSADSSAGLYHVHSQFAGTLLDCIQHIDSP